MTEVPHGRYLGPHLAGTPDNMRSTPIMWSESHSYPPTSPSIRLPLLARALGSDVTWAVFYAQEDWPSPFPEPLWLCHISSRFRSFPPRRFYSSSWLELDSRLQLSLVTLSPLGDNENMRISLGPLCPTKWEASKGSGLCSFLLYMAHLWEKLLISHLEKPCAS